jgi:hypothetical protein
MRRHRYGPLREQNTYPFSQKVTSIEFLRAAGGDVNQFLYISHDDDRLSERSDENLKDRTLQFSTFTSEPPETLLQFVSYS